MAKKDLIKRADGSYSPRGLWDNIRANAGSGKKPTKEMLAQEKKINKMANGGKMSSFKASNIQTYAEGGATGGPDLPLGVKKAFEKGTILANPLYMNSFSGALVPQYSVGFATAPVSDQKPGWTITGRVGKEYQGAQDKFKEVFGEQGIPSQMGIPLPKNMSYGLNAEFRGKTGLDGQRFTPLVSLGADVAQSGVGLSATGGGQFNFGRHNYRQGQLKDGYAAGSAGAFGGWAAGSQAFGPYYGAEGHVDWRPKFFGEVPGMLYGKGKVGIVPGGFPPAIAAELGYKMPVQKAAQIDLPKISMPNMSPLTSFLGRAGKGGEENLQMQGGDPMGDFGPRYNASPIDKRWNSGAADIYVPSTKSGPNAEPIIYDPNDPEGLGENNFKRGGAMKYAVGGNLYSMGGRAFANGGQLTEFNEGGSHEMNPLGGIPQGFAQDGKLNLVEQGETKLNAADYVFSDQIKVSKETASLYDLPNSTVGKTFADASKKANRPNSRRENDTIEQVAIQRDLENLMQAQEQQKETEKQAAIAEMQAKYPDVQIVDQAAMQQADADMQASMQQPMMDEAAMMQQQQQMAPPAGMPQEMDPAMMAQMQQQGMMCMGGKMYNMGGHLYSMGGRMYNLGGNMVLRGIGAGAYGIAEGALDTLTFGLTDNLTDKGYEKLSSLGADRLDDKSKGRLDATRGFGNTAGAIGAAALTGGATTKSAISEGVEGLAQGVSSLPGTNEKVDKIAQGVGQAASMYGSIAGGPPQNMSPIPKGVLEGNQAVTKLMNAPQNSFITQGMNIANRMFAQGGFLGSPTTGMFTNQFAPGGSMSDPIAVFNINGTPVTMSYSQAIANPTILDMFMPDDADVDGDGKYGPEDIEMAKEALREHFATMGTGQPEVVTGGAIPENVEEEVVVEDVAPEGGMTAEEYLAGLEKPEGMSESEFKKMKTNLTQKETLGEMKASPILAAASALPAMYNIGRGMFGKVDQLDAKDYQSRAMISPYEMNVDPQLAAAQRAYSTAMQAAKNASPGAGSYLATLGNLATQKQQAIRDLYAQKENFDKAQKLEADKFNAQVESQNMSQDLAIQQYNAQAQSAKDRLLETGLGQVADVATGLTNQDLQEKYLQTIAPEFAGSFKYMSIPEQLAAMAAARKAAKSTKG